jgi:hypothetical protein
VEWCKQEKWSGEKATGSEEALGVAKLPTRNLKIHEETLSRADEKYPSSQAIVEALSRLRMYVPVIAHLLAYFLHARLERSRRSRVL